MAKIFQTPLVAGSTIAFRGEGGKEEVGEVVSSSIDRCVAKVLIGTPQEHTRVVIAPQVISIIKPKEAKNG